MPGICYTEEGGVPLGETMNNHQEMAMDDIFIIGLLAAFLWYRVMNFFGWGVLIGAILCSLLVGARIYHLLILSNKD